MKGLILFALVALAAWYGWTNYRQIFEKRPSHEAMIENLGDTAMQRVRLRVDGQSLAKEEIPGGEKVVLPFRVNQDSKFELEWTAGSRELYWSGGLVTVGPMLQRHVFSVDDNGEVMYRAENK